ncbi:MAG: Lysophospholipase [Rhodobacteraceae bacterium HLUCCA12]|nr:MAG: Lysophospholipase [Rhodobacteraceae bacterium HLUCCA12]
MKVAVRILLSVFAGLLGTLAVALGLIASDRPVADPRAASGEGLAFAGVLADGPTDIPLAPPHRAVMGDGTELGYRRWDSDDAGAPLVVALHGSGWHGAQFAALGPALAQAGAADVVAPDLRGHGLDPVRRGDIDHVAQLEDDLADLIDQVRAPGQRVVMLGHSSGGGLVMRFAGGRHGDRLDAAILLAPYLQHDAPTARDTSGGWTRVLTRRIIGLTMLNAIGLTQLNHLTALQFRFPDAVLDGPWAETVTRAYSYRMMTGFNPRRDWGADVAALPDFLLVAGAEDEAFVAQAYEPALSAHSTRGQYRLLPGVGHLDAVDDEGTRAAIAAFLAARP